MQIHVELVEPAIVLQNLSNFLTFISNEYTIFQVNHIRDTIK
jgi:hypothetical protein